MTLSVIVPVYRVEKYLRKCVDSILKQTMQDLELILVDDGSPDACPSICDEYAGADARVIVIHQENAGVSTARNRGLEIAKGDWITFVDSDDYLALDAYEQLLTAAKQGDCDLAIMDWACVDESGQVRPGRERKYGDIEYLTAQRVYGMQFDIPATIRTSLVNKVFKRHVIEGLQHDTSMRCAEDTYVLSQCLERVHKAVLIRQPYYLNLQREGSAMRGGLRAVDYELACQFHKKIALRAKEIYPVLWDHAFAFYIDQVIWKMHDQIAKTKYIAPEYIQTHKKAISDMRKRLRRESLCILKCKEFNYKQKIRFVLLGLGI